MNQQKVKLFRPLFHDKSAFRKFKKAYSSAIREKRLETITTAIKVRAGGVIHHGVLPNGQ